jgi:YfiH family protein
MSKLPYLPAAWPDYVSEGRSESSVDKQNKIHAFTTLRSAGFSKGDYSQYNLATHVGENIEVVRKNRAKLLADLKLPAEPVWLEQVHSNKVLRIDKQVSCAEKIAAIEPADASVTGSRGVVCAVLTADCLPLFFCNQSATEVAVAHAGWRGLYQGIISNTVKAMSSSVDDILVSLGPAIGAKAFEVGEEVFSAFVAKNNSNRSAFVATENNRYLCDIYQLARIELGSIGVTQVRGGNHCTYTENHQFYSYRKQANTGRMASLIWIG